MHYWSIVNLTFVLLDKSISQMLIDLCWTLTIEEYLFLCPFTSRSEKGRANVQIVLDTDHAFVIWLLSARHGHTHAVLALVLFHTLRTAVTNDAESIVNINILATCELRRVISYLTTLSVNTHPGRDSIATP